MRFYTNALKFNIMSQRHRSLEVFTTILLSLPLVIGDKPKQFSLHILQILLLLILLNIHRQELVRELIIRKRREQFWNVDY